MSIEELASNGSEACRAAFAYLRTELTSLGHIQETVEFEPLKNTEAPTYKVGETPRVRAFFGDKLEVFLFIPEKSVESIKEDNSIPQPLRALVDRAQQGGMSRLLRVQLGSRSDVEVVMPLIRAITT